MPSQWEKLTKGCKSSVSAKAERDMARGKGGKVVSVAKLDGKDHKTPETHHNVKGFWKKHSEPSRARSIPVSEYLASMQG